MRQQHNIFNKLDWMTAGIYLMLVFIGWVSIYASVYNEEHASIFDITQRYGMQLIWMGAGFALALAVLLIDHKFFSVFAYLIYGGIILLLVLVLVAGVEVNGSRSWFMLGPLRLQPAELAKLGTSLALAKFMSRYNFKLTRLSSLVPIGFLILLPVALILMQHDTGSALVFVSLLIMLYREGLSGWLVSTVAFFAVIFILSIIWTPLAIFLFLWIISIAVYALLRRNIFEGFAIAAVSIGVYVLIAQFLLPRLGIPNANNGYIFLMVCAATLIIGAIVALRKKIRSFWAIVLFFIGSTALVLSVDYMYDHLLKPHHRHRIEDMLGLKEDLQGVGYNVHQSKVAIGSGGFSQLRARTKHRLHFLHYRRRKGLHRRIDCHSALRLATDTHSQYFRAATRRLCPHLRLLRTVDNKFSRYHQHCHDHRAGAGYRHPPALHQLRRLFAVDLHPHAIHTVETRCGEVGLSLPPTPLPRRGLYILFTKLGDFSC